MPGWQTDSCSIHALDAGQLSAKRFASDVIEAAPGRGLGGSRTGSGIAAEAPVMSDFWARRKAAAADTCSEATTKNGRAR